MYFKIVKKKMRSDSAIPSCLHMTQPSAATVWLDLSLFIWPAEIQDLVYSNQKKNWRWTETSSEQPLLCKNIFKTLFLTHRKPWTTPLTDLNIFQSGFGLKDLSSQVRSDTSGQTEACNSLFGEIFLLPSCTEQHPCRSARTVLPSRPAPSCAKGHTVPHLCKAEPKHISWPSRGFLREREILAFNKRCLYIVFSPVPLFVMFTCTVPLLFFNSVSAFSLTAGMDSLQGF